MSKKLPEGMYIDKDGMLVLDTSSSAEADNWLLVGRLKKRAEAGDKEAQRKLKELENEEMVPWPEKEN